MQSSGKSLIDLLKDLQSPNNDTRNAAEAQVKSLRAEQAMLFLQQLCQIVVQS
jgi:hypothetical protein